MRIRTIKPEFWEHPVMSKQSDTTKLLAIGLLNVADDEGYFYAEPRMIRNAIRPLDDDSRITTVSLLELSKLGYISIKNHPTHGDIGFIPSFLNHQVINKPKSSKLKELYEYGSITVAIRDEYGLERKGKEGKGKELLCEESHDTDYPDEIETLWKSFNPKSKERSSKKQLKQEWNKIKNKPDIQTLVQKIEIWNKSDAWTKENRQFATGAHLFIKNEKWEIEPQVEKPKQRPLNEKLKYQQNGNQFRPFD